MTKKQFYLILAISILCFILAVSPKPPIPKHTIERKRTAMTIGYSKQNPHKKEALKHTKKKTKIRLYFFQVGTALSNLLLA